MGCARGMNDEAFRVANIRQVRPERDSTDEVLPSASAARAIERKHSASATRQVFGHLLMVAAGRQPWIGYVRGQGLPIEIVRDGEAVFDMTSHPKRQRFEPLKEEKGIEGA